MNDRARAAAGAGAVMLIGLVASVWPGATPPPAPVPCAEAEAWMVDALPGVGAATRAAMTDAVRAGRLDELPPAARARAEALFAAPGAR
ncbi:MAG TPA: hypothetical protein VEL07_02260 [Planctomycetota bacterium]|nr:hypothetical protein [Planctomycetota bacterium]